MGLSLFEQYQPMMDAAVDDMLGDSISLSTDNGASFKDTRAFFLFDEAGSGAQGFGVAELDYLRQRVRLKISKVKLPDHSVPWRVRSIKFPGKTFRMSGDQATEEGRYWLLDIQEV